MDKKINKEKFLPFAIEDVWKAISEQDQISKWFIQADFKAEVGYQYKFTHEKTEIVGEVLEANPVFDLVYTWMVNGTNVNTTVRWQLEKVEDGTKIHLEHFGFENYDEAQVAPLFENFEKGWVSCLQELEKYFDNVEKAV